MVLLRGNHNGIAVYGQIDWNQTAEALHNWIRGNDKVPGAWAEVDGQVTGLLSIITTYVYSNMGNSKHKVNL